MGEEIYPPVLLLFAGPKPGRGVLGAEQLTFQQPCCQVGAQLLALAPGVK